MFISNILVPNTAAHPQDASMGRAALVVMMLCLVYKDINRSAVIHPSVFLTIYLLLEHIPAVKEQEAEQGYDDEVEVN